MVAHMIRDIPKASEALGVREIKFAFLYEAASENTKLAYKMAQHQVERKN